MLFGIIYNRKNDILMKKAWTLLLAAMMSLPMAQAVIKVHTIGDSTMEQYNESTTDKRGWATYLGAFFDETQVVVNNRGKSGKDTRTYYNDNAYWASVKSQMSAGDYLIIQFAHNDEGVATYGTDIEEYKAAVHAVYPDSVITELRGTNPQTTYRQYLRLFIDEARALGVNPILVGPICRAYFSGNSIKRNGQHDLGDKFSKIENGVLYENQSLPAGDSTMSYVKAMKVVAAEKNVPFIDLTAATMELYLSYGEQQCLDLMFVNKTPTQKDQTHTNAMGANLIARSAAQLLKDAGILAQHITIPTSLSANPTSIAIGETYSGVEQNKEFLLTGAGLEPAAGTVSLRAAGDLTISTDGNTFSKTASSSYTNSSLFQKVWVRVSYTGEGEQNDTVYATLGEQTLAVPVTASVISLDGGSAVSALWALDARPTIPLAATCEGPISGSMTLSNMIAADYSKNDFVYASDPDTRVTMVRFHNSNAECSAKVDWPANEIDEVANRYIDFAISAPSTMEVRITSITMDIAAHSTSTMNCHINTGLGDTFAGETIQFERKALPSNTKTAPAQILQLDLKPMLTVPAGQTLHVRVLPWHEATEAKPNKYICIKNMKIEGMVFSEGTGIERAEDRTPRAEKVLRNGQLLIIKNGILYNAQGAVVK